MSEPRGYLLDTSVLLETLRPKPAAAITAWMESVPQDRLYVSAITIGELITALENVSDPERRTELMRWVLQDLQTWFHGNVLSLTPEVAAFWGSLAGRMGKIGVMTGLQAAFALKHQLTLVTREDVSISNLIVINPWK